MNSFIHLFVSLYVIQSSFDICISKHINYLEIFMDQKRNNKNFSYFAINFTVKTLKRRVGVFGHPK